MFKLLSGWFRSTGKASIEPLQYFPTEPRAYAEFVVDLIEASQPAERAMCVVAIENLKVTHQVVADEFAKRGQELDLDDALNLLHQRSNEVDDPIKSRKLLWYLLGSHVMRLDCCQART